jgi:stage III sporulation protein AA
MGEKGLGTETIQTKYSAACRADSVFRYISREVAAILKKTDPDMLGKAEEIRMRAGRPLMICFNGDDRFVERDGSLALTARQPVLITSENIVETLELVSKNSLYSYMEEIRNGFITLEGGHRVGVAGKAVLSEGRIRNIKEISGLNIRFAKEIIGCGGKVLKHIISGGSVCNTLIVSPPQCGKTTMLRDLARSLSNGEYALKGMKVGIVDERSEIASCKNGIPQFDVGLRTDVLDGCPKTQGLPMIIRTMSPEVVITDEIGNSGDCECIIKVLNAGVKVIASAHGYSIAEMKTREEVLKLIEKKAFDRYVVLSGREGPGTLEEVIDGETMKGIFRRARNAS